MIHVPMQPCRLCACLLAVRLQVLDRFSNCEFTCEFKYDGERAQIHLLADGSVKIFSRNSEVSGTLDPGRKPVVLAASTCCRPRHSIPFVQDNTTKYPDIAAIVPKAVKEGVTNSAILDAEAVAVDTKTGAILPFQV